MQTTETPATPSPAAAAAPLATRIQRRLDELKLSPITLANSVGLERTYIRDIAIGRKRSIRSDKQALVARALGWSVEQLLVAHDHSNRHGHPLAEYPEAIFGKVPPGFTLERQNIRMLDFWHQKARDAINALPEEADDGAVNAACDIQRALLAAIKSYQPQTAGEVACMMEAIVSAVDGDLEEYVSADEFRRLQEHLTYVTQPIPPSKDPGPLRRGRKLTRAGLLFRYASFLASELHTISHHLYGNRDYLKQFVVFGDHAVDIRVRVGKSGRLTDEAFNDTSNLTGRARKVLCSLKIDVTRDDDVPSRKRKGERR